MISHIIISMLSRDVRFKKYRYSLFPPNAHTLPYRTLTIAKLGRRAEKDCIKKRQWVIAVIKL